MAISPLVKIKTIIDKTWDKVWSTIKDHTFTVSVNNQIEIPEVEFPDIKFPEIPKPVDTTPELKDIVKTILEQTKELKSSPDTTATKQQLLEILDKIHEKLSIDKEDFTPDLVSEIGALRDDLSKIGSQIPKTDLKPIQEGIEALGEALDFSGLEKFQRFDDWRVYINEKQFDKLLKAFNISVSAGGGGVQTVKLESGDLEIGAVEIKDGDSDTRLDVESDGTKNAAFIQANTLPLPTGAAASAAQLADDHNVQVSNKLVPEKWDYTALTVGGTTDTWVFKTGGSGGSTVATVVITYTDATKATISNVAKT